VAHNYFTHPDKGPVTETAMAAAHRPGNIDPVGHGRGTRVVGVGAAGDSRPRLSARWRFSTSLALQFYGIALTGLGLLTTTGFILAMDTLRTDHRQRPRIFEMGGIHQEEASKRCRGWTRLAHDQGAHEGPRDCDRGSGGRLAVPLLYR